METIIATSKDMYFNIIILPSNSVLNKTGNGDGFFSSLFQTTLEGNKLQNATVAGEVWTFLNYFQKIKFMYPYNRSIVTVSIDVFFNDLFRLLANYFLLLGCVNIPITIG